MRSPLDVRAVTSALSDDRWAAVQVVSRAASTNAAVLEGGRLWTAVATDHQTAGRGRMGRTWVTPPHAALAVSALLPLPDDRESAGWVPLLTGLAVRDTLADLTGLQTSLKWPNDVLVPSDQGRKVCGVLCELHATGIVVGIGVNVLQTRGELPVPTATSLALCGVVVSREGLLAGLLDRLAVSHQAVLDGGSALQSARSAYRTACDTIGHEVELHHSTGRPDQVLAVGVDVQGRLLVRDGSGEYAVAAADVVHVRGQGEQA